MAYKSVTCPRCGATHEYLLSREKTHHLRACPACDQWFVVHALASEDGYVTEMEVESLGDPAACPVAECEETFVGDALPRHVIDEHGGSIAARPE